MTSTLSPALQQLHATVAAKLPHITVVEASPYDIGYWARRAGLPLPYGADDQSSEACAGWQCADHEIREHEIEPQVPAIALTGHIETALVFAARYAHDRQTGAALAVVTALESCWAELSPRTREQILEEALNATCNLDDWKQLREFAGAQPPAP